MTKEELLQLRSTFQEAVVKAGIEVYASHFDGMSFYTNPGAVVVAADKCRKSGLLDKKFPSMLYAKTEKELYNMAFELELETRCTLKEAYDFCLEHLDMFSVKGWPSCDLPEPIRNENLAHLVIEMI